MIVSELKVLRIVEKSTPEGIPNIGISKIILEENEGEVDLKSVKVLVSRKTSELLDRGELERVGRRFRITGRGIKRLNSGKFARTSYELGNKAYSNMQVSIAVPPNQGGNIFYEDREIDEALNQLNEALEKKRDFSIIIKSKEDEPEQ